MEGERFLPGKISIGRPSGDGCDYIDIEVIDQSSHTRFVEIRVPYAGMMLALTGAGDQDCEFRLRDVDRVGMIHKYKTETVLVPKDLWSYVHGDERQGRLRSVVRPAVAVHEIDGWTGYDRDATNDHRRLPMSDTETHHAYSVHYDRWAAPDGPREETSDAG